MLYSPQVVFVEFLKQFSELIYSMWWVHLNLKNKNILDKGQTLVQHGDEDA